MALWTTQRSALQRARPRPQGTTPPPGRSRRSQGRRQAPAARRGTRRAQRAATGHRSIRGPSRWNVELLGHRVAVAARSLRRTGRAPLHVRRGSRMRRQQGSALHGAGWRVQVARRLPRNDSLVGVGQAECPPRHQGARGTGRTADRSRAQDSRRTCNQTKLRRPDETPLERQRARRRPILPRSCPLSIFGAGELDFRVRDGNGYGLSATVTGLRLAKSEFMAEHQMSLFHRGVSRDRPQAPMRRRGGQALDH